MSKVQISENTLNPFLFFAIAAQAKSKTSKSSADSTSSTISTASIKMIVDKLSMERNCSTTRNNYHKIWKGFNKFYLRLDEKPSSWEDRLVLFVGYLVDKNRKASTIRSYISAIKSVLREIKIEISEDSYLLNSLTRACKYRTNNKVRIRLPIHKDLLQAILKEIDKKYLIKQNQPYLALLYKTIIASGYYGMFRIGELTKGDHPVLARDVRVGDNKQKMLFILRTSKTHWKDSPPQIVKISSLKLAKHKRMHGGVATNKIKYCPYLLLRRYSKARIEYKADDEQFFVFRDRSPVTCYQASKVLKEALKDGGFNPNNYSAHSLRAGRAGDLLKLGVSVETIKILWLLEI